MDDRRFDALVKSLATGISRRGALKGLLGAGGAAAVGAMLRDPAPADAQRRPTPTPRPPTCPGNQIPCGRDCCCPDGSELCGAECCVAGASVCCDGACCFGTCTPDESCCEPDSPVCTVDGCCSGVCIDNGQYCCPANQVCGDGCCADTEHCCAFGPGAPRCLSFGACCTDAECLNGRCQNGVCIPNTPTPPPTSTNTAVPTNTATPTKTAVPSSTPTPSNTRTATPTKTATPSRTPTKTATPSPTPAQSRVRVEVSSPCLLTAILEGFVPNHTYSVLILNVAMEGGWPPYTEIVDVTTDGSGRGATAPFDPRFGSLLQAIDYSVDGVRRLSVGYRDSRFNPCEILWENEYPAR